MAARHFKPKACAWCGTEFTPTAPRATYCTPECFKAKNRERMRKYHATHKDADREYYTANKERILESPREYRQANKEHLNAKHREYYQNNKEHISAQARKYRWEAGDKTCILCGEPIDPTLKAPHNMSRTIEHLTPIARGGRHDIDNIDFAHYGCNAQKQDRTLEEYREWRERVA